MSGFDDDDDFQTPPTRPTLSLSHKPSSLTQRPSKIPRRSASATLAPPFCSGNRATEGFKCPDFVDCSLDSIPLSFDRTATGDSDGNGVDELLDRNRGYSRNSIESRLLKSGGDRSFDAGGDDGSSDDDEDEGELDELLKLCSGSKGGDFANDSDNDGVVDDGNEGLVECPLCGVDISDLNEEQRHRHTNECLDKEDIKPQAGCAKQVLVSHEEVEPRAKEQEPRVSRKSGDVSGVVEWLSGLGLAKYEDIFAREEIDWESLQWLTEEDLLNIGITALGPRKKIMHAVSQLRKGSGRENAADTVSHVSDEPGRGTDAVEKPVDGSELLVDNITSKTAANKLITDYFPGFSSHSKKVRDGTREQSAVVKKSSGSGRKDPNGKKLFARGKLKDPPLWCRIPGTPFRVDAFQYLRGDCSHWFLTHFHMDHYQGLTKSFCHGKIYCSSITAKLVNLKIGIPWDRLHALPLNQKITVGGIDVTCLDANHCPGAIVILFEPPDSKAVLHTGDFRFREDKDLMSLLGSRFIHTLILDTTYCNPQYDFPKQETVIQFVVDAVQAETFNPKTLFLIGSYTIGKERLFLEVARVLRKKVYVNAAKLRILNCLDFPLEDMRWFTQNEKESQIHVVPMWTIASFKRLKHVANHYKLLMHIYINLGRYSLIVAFTPTGWTFDKGKKSSSPGRKWRQGTIIRYEVPYSEHSSFTELKEFVKIVSPVNIIPSVNNHSPESANSMVSLLVS